MTPFNAITNQSRFNSRSSDSPSGRVAASARSSRAAAPGVLAHSHAEHRHPHHSAGPGHSGHDAPAGHGGHQHGPGGHNHLHGVTDQRRIGWAFAIIALFMFVEVAGGVISGSLALLADAGHMVSDAAALGFSWLAIHYGKRPATQSLSYGYKRLEILAAFTNGCALFVIAGWIVFEAVTRFRSPVPIAGVPMLVVAVIGLLANIAAFWVLNGGNRDNLNLRGAWLHVLGDMLGSVAAIVAAGVIMASGWTPIDPLLSILVAVIILKSAWGIVTSSAHILLEGTPPGIDPVLIKADLEDHLEQVSNAHHIHVWSITGERHMVTLHVHPSAGHTATEVVAAVRVRLNATFGIDHVTVQIEEAECVDTINAQACCEAGSSGEHKHSEHAGHPAH